MNSPSSVLGLSRIKAVREWDEGYEELEFMPNGFAVELKDGAPWLFFAESKEEKVSFLFMMGVCSRFLKSVNYCCRKHFLVCSVKRAASDVKKTSIHTSWEPHNTTILDVEHFAFPSL